MIRQAQLDPWKIYQRDACFDGWFVSVFNKVDKGRIKEVGVDRAAAEWLLRCGAGVRWKNSDKFLRDYNSLPSSNIRNVRIVAIDGTEAAIMETGFVLLQDLECLEEVVLSKNKYISDDSLGYFCSFTRDKLIQLTVANNGQLTDKGLRHLRVMKKLTELKLERLPGVEDPSLVLRELKQSLPNCTIQYPPHTDSQDGQS